jgi:hypothetical protein
MVLSILVTWLLSVGAGASATAEDGFVIGPPSRFDCRVHVDRNQLDLVLLGEQSARHQVLHSHQYYFPYYMNVDYLDCHRALALAEAYAVDISANSKTGVVTPQLGLNQSATLLPSKPELLSCEIIPEGSRWPNTITIQYRDHVIYRNYSLTGFNFWKSWIDSCTRARDEAKASGGVVLVDLQKWTFKAFTP